MGPLEALSASLGEKLKAATEMTLQLQQNVSKAEATIGEQEAALKDFRANQTRLQTMNAQVDWLWPECRLQRKFGCSTDLNPFWTLFEVKLEGEKWVKALAATSLADSG